MSVTNASASLTDSGVDARFSLWRHSDGTVRAAGDAHLGDHALSGDVVAQARQVYELGARFVSIEPTVEIGPEPGAERMIPLLSFVRELTSYGLEVDWRARMAPGGPEWWVFSHLFPPSVLDGPRADEALTVWRARYHVGRCFLRRGPGFMQIRDRRHGGLRRMTVSDDVYISAIDSVLTGQGADFVPEPVVSVLEKQNLFIRIGNGLWCAPYRLRRWPLPSWEV
jgi:hypothetical protein